MDKLKNATVEFRYKQWRVPMVEVFGDERQYVIIGLDEWYPEENFALGNWVGDLIGKTYVWKAVASEEGDDL